MTTTHERPTEFNSGTPPVQPPAPRSGEATPPAPNKKRKRGSKVLAITLAAGLVVGGGAATYALLNPSAPTSQGSDPSEPNDGGQPANPGTVEVDYITGEIPTTTVFPKSPEIYNAEDLKIPSGLSADQVGRLIVADRFSKWQNAGFNDTQIAIWYSTDDSNEENFINGVVQNQAIPFKDALFLTDETSVGTQEDKDSVNNIVNIEMGLNTKNLDNSFQTSDITYDAIPFHRWYQVENGSSETSSNPTIGTRVIEVPYTERTNADQNRIGEDAGGSIAGVEGAKGTFTITLQAMADGSEKIIAITTVTR